MCALYRNIPGEGKKRAEKNTGGLQVRTRIVGDSKSTAANKGLNLAPTFSLEKINPVGGVTGDPGEQFLPYFASGGESRSKIFRGISNRWLQYR